MAAQQTWYWQVISRLAKGQPGSKKTMKKTNQKEQEQFVVEANLDVNGEEKIAKRAYELWQQRNFEHGNDLADWFQAEREVNQ